MMPAGDIARRRARYGATPPGFRLTPVPGSAKCMNNSALQKTQTNNTKIRTTVPPVPTKKPSKTTTTSGSIKLRPTVPPIPMKNPTKPAAASGDSKPPSDKEDYTRTPDNRSPGADPAKPQAVATEKAGVHKMMRQLKSDCMKGVSELKADCIKGVKEELMPDCTKGVAERLKPDCLRDVTQKDPLAWVKTIRKPKTVEYLAPTMECKIAGEEVILNIFPKLDEQQAPDLELDKSLTPMVAEGQPFEQTCEFFSQITSNRNDVQRAMYRLGDQLLHGEVEGDKDDWLNHVMQLATDVAAWEKRCDESADYREKTGKILGVEEKKFKARATRFGTNLLNTVKGYASRICPCFFRGGKEKELRFAPSSTSSLHFDGVF